MIGLIGRYPTATSLYEFAKFAGGGGLNLFSFFGLTVKLCPGLQNAYSEGCNDMWLESNYQGSRNMNRISLSQVLATAERKVADYVGYWTGPKYIENERHFMKHWKAVITTNYMRVPITGTRRRTLLFSSDTVPMTRTFLNGLNPYLGSVIRYKFGEVGTSLNLDPDCNLLLYPQGIDELPLSSGDLDTEKTINEGYRLRPFIVVEKTDEFLTIDVPLVVAVNPELYFEYPDIKGNIRLLDACDENNFIDKIAVYAETYHRPDGYVKIARRACMRCGGSGCEGCNLPELPVCLVPISSEEGLFQVKPIRNTGTDEDPCWEISDVESCCAAIADGLRWPHTFDRRWACNQYCTKPLELCVSYVSSCNNCYGDDCLDRIVCQELLDPIAKITLAEIQVFCDCTCFKDMIARLRDEYPLRGKGFSRAFIDEAQYNLGGMMVGHVEAWLALKNVEGKHRTPRLGMVG